MMADSGWRLREMPRERLEDLALRAALELRNLRQEQVPNRVFLACCYAFMAGAVFAAAGFATGALLR